MKLLIGLLCCLSIGAIAATDGYELKIDISLNGKHTSSPKVRVKAGEKAFIVQEDNSDRRFIEVIATEGDVQGHKGILMKFIIGSMAENGQQTIVSEPQILAKESELAKVILSDVGSGKDQLSLSVIANRVSF